MSFWDDIVNAAEAVVDPFGIAGAAAGAAESALGLGGDKKGGGKDDGGSWWDMLGTDEDKIAEKKGGGKADEGWGTDERAIMKELKAEPAEKFDMIRESFSMKDMGGDFFEKKGGGDKKGGGMANIAADMGKAAISGALGGGDKKQTRGGGGIIKVGG
jgi:hypothetical protein